VPTAIKNDRLAVKLVRSNTGLEIRAADYGDFPPFHEEMDTPMFQGRSF